MKTTAFSILAISLSLAAFTPDKNKHTDSFAVDTKNTKMDWVGKKVTGQHNGTVAIKSGNLQMDHGKIAGGTFEIDMTTLTATDLQGEYQQKLDGHLKSDDFFGVENFPTAKLVINKAEMNGNTAKISGDLTIKGKTNPIVFDAVVNAQANRVIADATITVNRAKYDIKYGSTSFFEGLGDKAIYDDFTLTVHLVANSSK